MNAELPKASTFSELLVELRRGFTLYAPILVRVSADGEGFEGTLERTTALTSRSLDWGEHYAREYGDEPYVLLGPNTLASTEPIKIGRSRTCDVRIDSESVSKVHATMMCDRATGEYFVVDESSRNGTSINGEALIPGIRMAIWAGAYVSFGDAVYVFIDPPTLRKLSRLAG